MAYRSRGLGAWPTDCFYDPGRPSWLPYWLDTPTESQNKLACALATGAAGPLGILAAGSVAVPVTNPYTLPPSPVPVVPPDLSIDPTGANVDVDAQLAAQKAAQQASVQQWAAQQAQQTPVDNTSAGAIFNQLAAGGIPVGNLTIPSWVVYLGVGVGALFLLNLAKGLR